ncbi:MAG TPA: hypothetical protein VLM40_23670, partial [Gemmata sp.]|nr:hypothetical protein [Gemmata sp.]
MTIYTARRDARRATAASLTERLDRLSYGRLAAFLLAAGLAGVGFGTDWLSPWFAVAPLLAFFYLVARFEMTRGRRGWAERAAAYYSAGLDRLEGKPAGPDDGARFANHDHPYSDDLDLFGPNSIFQRLSACRTRVGEDTLASWLLTPATPTEVQERQLAVADLKPRLDLREAVAVAGASTPAADYAQLVAWGKQSSVLIPRWKVWAVELLGWLNVV